MIGFVKNGQNVWVGYATETGVKVGEVEKLPTIRGGFIYAAFVSNSTGLRIIGLDEHRTLDDAMAALVSYAS